MGSKGSRGAIRPSALKARRQATSEYLSAGRMREERYAFGIVEEMKRYVGKESRLVNCLRVSLSLHDLLRVVGASGREGLRRRIPREEK